MPKHCGRASRRTFALERLTTPGVAHCEHRKHRKRPERPRDANAAKATSEGTRLFHEHRARLRVTAMARRVDQRPQSSRALNPLVGTIHNPRAEAEQQISAE